jgi:two-component system nitrate/nitrite response regulator NarL
MSGEKPIKVLIADDYRLIREGLRRYLTKISEINLVGEASTGLEVIELTEELNPDIVLMNISLPVLDGFESSKIIKQTNKNTAILMLTFHYTDQNALKAMKNGVDGILPKYANEKEIVKAINGILKGELYFEQKVKVAYHKWKTGDKSKNTNLPYITPKEEEILQLVALNYTNKKIGEKLFISHHTVETHKKNLIRKLNLQNTRELHTYALEYVKNNGNRY